MGEHTGMLGAWIPDTWVFMFELDSVKAARTLSIERHKINEQFLKAEKKGRRKKIINLENPMIKTLIKEIKTLYFCMHRQFVIQWRLGSAINRALNELEKTRKQLIQSNNKKKDIIQQILLLIDQNIADLSEFRRQIITLLDKEIEMINKAISGGQIFTGLIKIAEGGAFSENIVLIKKEARDIRRLTNLFERLHFLTASAANAAQSSMPEEARENAFKTFGMDLDELKKIVNDLKAVSKDELNMMNILFYDQLTLITYEDEDINKMANFFKKLGQEGFPPTAVADFLRKIDKKVEGERKSILKQLKTEAGYAESRVER